MAGSSEEHVRETREQVRQFVAEKLDKNGVIRVRDAYPRSYPGDLASLRLIDYYIGRGEDHLAEREARHFLAAFPAHPSVQKVGESLELLKTRLKFNQYFIAAVLPCQDSCRRSRLTYCRAFNSRWKHLVSSLAHHPSA